MRPTSCTAPPLPTRSAEHHPPQTPSTAPDLWSGAVVVLRAAGPGASCVRSAAVTALGLALVAALTYGLSDFVGGVASHRASAWAVALLSQLGGASAVLVVALVVGVPAWLVVRRRRASRPAVVPAETPTA